MNERYLFVVVSGSFFAFTHLFSLLQPGYYHLTFPPVKVPHVVSFTLMLTLLIMKSQLFTAQDSVF